MVRLNCEAVVALSHAYAPAMVERGAGAILIVASSAGFQPIPGQATYGASKAFALSFAEALHTELSHLGVAVTALCPGPIDTEFADRAGLADAFAACRPSRASRRPTAPRRRSTAGRNRRVVMPGVAIRPGLSSRYTPHAILLPLLKRFYPA